MRRSIRSICSWHCDLKLQAEHTRAVLAEDTTRQDALAQSAAELGLRTENAMLIEQNYQLRQDLDIARAALRRQRCHELAAAATGALSGRLPPDPTVADLQRQLDELRAALYTAEADLAAVRDLNQRLVVENSRLLDKPRATPAGPAASR